MAATEGGVRLGSPDAGSRLLSGKAAAVSPDDRVWDSDWPAAYDLSALRRDTDPSLLLGTPPYWRLLHWRPAYDLSDLVHCAPRFPDAMGTPRDWPRAHDLSRFGPHTDFAAPETLPAPLGWPRAYNLSRLRASVAPEPVDEICTSSVRPRPNDPELIRALQLRSGLCGWKSGLYNTDFSDEVGNFMATVLVLPRSERWYTAVHTALIGDWSDPLLRSGHLARSALGVLKAEARTLHRQAVPLWRRRTRHGRVLSLDADLGGLSLYDLAAADIDHLARTFDGVFEDERLNLVLRGLDPDECAVVFAYAEGEGTTWTEAAAVAGQPEPAAFGERVRRKVKRLAAEQRRRTALRQAKGSSL